MARAAQSRWTLDTSETFTEDLPGFGPTHWSPSRPRFEDKDERQLTLALRLPREGGETALVSTLEAEPGIARMQLDPAS
jgi:hypothetical protein